VLFCLTVFNATFNNFLMNVGVPEGWAVKCTV
jgi:hypothetical protein